MLRMGWFNSATRFRFGVGSAGLHPLAVAFAAACCVHVQCDAPPGSVPARSLKSSAPGGGGGGGGGGARSNASLDAAATAAAAASLRSTPLISVVAAQGHRSYMEDTHFISRDGSFVGVYDGHGGSRVSAFLRKALHARFKEHWKEATATNNATGNDDVSRAVQQAFREVDEAVQRNQKIAVEGSTAAVVIIPHLLKPPPSAVADGGVPKRILTANLGDSRAVLSRKGKAVELTSDHKPNAARERRRVEDLGGAVKWFGYYDTEGRPVKGTGCWRINGNLAVSRAFGDKYDRPYVSGECELKSFEYREDEDQFIIVASDGLWDVMSSSEAVQYVQTMLTGSVGALREGSVQQGNRPTDVDLRTWSRQYSKDRGLVRAALMSRKKKMAKYLVEEALRRGTFDNITVVILWLK